MPRITYIQSDGRTETLEVPVGTSVMQAALTHGVTGILAECLGALSCATCHVYVDPDQLDRLPGLGSAEDDMLECTAGERLPNSRLSCQIIVTPEMDGLAVRVPTAQV